MSDLHVPAEWAPRKAIWTAWPSDGSLWKENLKPARAEVAVMARALTLASPVKVLAAGDEAVASARAALGDAAEIIAQTFGDIWLRDTGPIFAKRNGKPAALAFRFNGWGGKYVLDHDDEVASAIARASEVPLSSHNFVLEGGAVELDGEGTLLTTRQCLLNPNRNPGWTERDAEIALRGALGVDKILWLDEGLANDHTDGHIDNLARFIAPGVVVCQHPVANDPNKDVLNHIARDLAAMRDAKGRKLEVRTIPSPGAVLGTEGEVVPASHMNFVTSPVSDGKALVAPAYSLDVEALSAAFTALDGVVHVAIASSIAILTGGGSFHCITQQEPA